MKPIINQFILAAVVFLAAGTPPLLAQSPQSGTISKTEDSTSYYMNLVLDPSMNMRSGAETLAEVIGGI